MSFPEFDPAEFAELHKRPIPQLLPVPSEARGFRIRVELTGTSRPIWRRLEVPSNTELPQLHLVLQAAMGWNDAHLHQFRVEDANNEGEFLTSYDFAEGLQGQPEAGIRLDQILNKVGDELWYSYDFGDGWEHLLQLEAVLDSPPKIATCIAGELACPPEDCGGIGGYESLAAWVRADYAHELLPPVFEEAWIAREWLPRGWHPDRFDVAEANDWVAAAVSDPIPVKQELAELLEESLAGSGPRLRNLLAHPATHGPTEVSTHEATNITHPYRVLLDLIGDGMALTSAGHLKPATVERIAYETGIASWWIGNTNRENHTRPVADLRNTARMLGLVSVRKGQISPTAAARKIGYDSNALLQHIVGRLPLGKSEFERHAGWMLLTVLASDSPTSDWRDATSELLAQLGWHTNNHFAGLPSPDSPTLRTLHCLTNWADRPFLGTDRPGVPGGIAAMARQVLRD